MIRINLDSAIPILVDTFVEMYIDGIMVHKEETITEMIAGEVEVSKRKVKLYYEGSEEGNTLISTEVEKDGEVEIIRWADDNHDKDLGNIELEDDGRGYSLIFKRIKVTYPIESVSTTTFVVNENT